MSPDNCPNCGADLPRNAKVCPECGSDEKTGWSDEAAAQGLDLPDENFEYDEFVKREFGQEKKIRPRGIPWVWWVSAVLVLALFLYFVLR